MLWSATACHRLPTYLTIAKGQSFDRSSVADYSTAVLRWWANHRSEIPTWAKAARIVFALTPNSASCERVFSLVKCMFGGMQMAALADHIQVALMLRYNKRLVG